MTPDLPAPTSGTAYIVGYAGGLTTLACSGRVRGTVYPFELVASAVELDGVPICRSRVGGEGAPQEKEQHRTCCLIIDGGENPKTNCLGPRARRPQGGPPRGDSNLWSSLARTFPGTRSRMSHVLRFLRSGRPPPRVAARALSSVSRAPVHFRATTLVAHCETLVDQNSADVLAVDLQQREQPTIAVAMLAILDVERA